MMKKPIMLAICFTLFSSIISSAQAKDEPLCIGLLNKSSETVSFSGSGLQPNGFPHVASEQMRVLGESEWVSCGDSCTVYVIPSGPSAGVVINNVPRGALIIYFGTDQYKLDETANLKCDWAT